MLFVVVAGAGSGLVFSSPGRPGQDVGDRVQWPQQQGDEESAEFVDCQGDQRFCAGRAGRFGASLSGGSDGQEGVREEGQGDPSVPGGPGADLVFVQPGQPLAGLEGLLDLPAPSGDPHVGAEGDRIGAVQR